MNKVIAECIEKLASGKPAQVTVRGDVVKGVIVPEEILPFSPNVYVTDAPEEYDAAPFGDPRVDEAREALLTSPEAEQFKKEAKELERKIIDALQSAMDDLLEEKGYL